MARKKKTDEIIPQETEPQIQNETPETETVDDTGTADEEFTENDEPDTDEPEDDENADAIADASAMTVSSNARLRALMNQNFIEFASYVIKDRAIPDIDDGLKPVQRRILWAMHLSDDGTFHKVAGVIGDTMKFHPHGDASIGDALVYLANKELFIEKQGNYGSIITGKPAAAPRYIECRLSALAKEVLFNREITELIDSYDGRGKEPVILPSKIPTLLILGSDGIAVGTNTKIMPHNFCEVLEAQIAILKGEEFTLYPDFFQGGIMDVSRYEDGMGKIVTRAKMELDGRNIVVKEVPASTTTEKLMESIDKAINKNKIKITTCRDYTAAEVDIHLTPMRGTDPAKTMNALYAFTDCQLSISCNPMVICDNRPRRMTVSDILRRNTEKLVQYLTWELHLEAGKCLDKILARTLAQIFIEERIYKRIEKCKSKEAMFTEVRKGLEEHRAEWLPLVQALYENLLSRPAVMKMDDAAKSRLEQLAAGNIPDAEIDKLVEIPIRRISAFEIDENREAVEALQKTLHEAEKNLKRIKQYTIKYLQGLLDRYGKFFPRRTEICLDGFEKIDMHKVALNNIRVGWDKKNCYIGTNVKSDDIVLCSEVDHLLCVERTGDFKIINIPEKIYIDRLFEFRKYDKTTVFGIVYSEKKTQKLYMKRTCIDKFITDKEYRIIPEGCRLELITSRPNAIYEIKIDTPVKSRQVQEINLMDAPLRSAKAGGTPVAQRKLLKITFLRYVDEPTQDAPALIEVEPDPLPEATEEPVQPEADTTDVTTEESAETNAEPAKTKPERASAKPAAKAETPAAKAEKKPETPAAAEQSGDDDETWGIQPDLGF